MPFQTPNFAGSDVVLPVLANIWPWMILIWLVIFLVAFWQTAISMLQNIHSGNALAWGWQAIKVGAFSTVILVLGTGVLWGILLKVTNTKLF